MPKPIWTAWQPTVPLHGQWNPLLRALARQLDDWSVYQRDLAGLIESLNLVLAALGRRVPGVATAGR